MNAESLRGGGKEKTRDEEESPEKDRGTAWTLGEKENQRLKVSEERELSQTSREQTARDRTGGAVVAMTVTVMEIQCGVVDLMTKKGAN